MGRPMSLCAALVATALLPDRAWAGDPPTQAVVQPSRPEPPSGKPMFGWGVFGVVFGIVNIGYGIPLSILGPGDAYFSGAIPIAFGAGFVVLGSLGVHYGKRRRTAWRSWAAANPATAARSDVQLRVRDRAGTGMLIGGGTAIVGGLATLPPSIIYTLAADTSIGDPRPIGPVVGMVVSTASIATGIALLGVGTHRRVQARRTQRGSSLRLHPTGWADAHGWGFGVAGWF